MLSCAMSLVLVAYDALGRRTSGPHRSVLYAVSLLGSLAFLPPDSVGYTLHAATMAAVCLACVGLTSHPACTSSAASTQVRYAHVLFAPAVGLAALVHHVHCVVHVTVWAWASALAHTGTASWTDIVCGSAARSALYAAGGSALQEFFEAGEGLWAFVHADGAQRVPPHPKWGPATNTAMFNMVLRMANKVLSSSFLSQPSAPPRRANSGAGGPAPRATRAPPMTPVAKKPMGDVLDAPSSDDDE